MKALSIRQPWAWLIVNAGKDIENRTWPTMFRGPVLIHASKGMTRSEYAEAVAFVHSQVHPGITVPPFEALERGGIVGRAVVTGCVSDSCSPWFGGPFGFQLEKVEALPFRPCSGALGFFTPKESK